VSTCAVHILQFSMASNHVSCRYRQTSEPKPVRDAGEPSRSRGNDPLRRAGLRIIGVFSTHDVGDPTVPLTPRRPSPPSRSEDPSFDSSLARFPRRLVDRPRLVQTRTPSTIENLFRMRPTRTVRSASQHRRSSPRPEGLRYPTFAPVVFTGESSTDRHRSTASAAFQITRPATTSAASGPPTRSRAPG
jgi:hypothetical protein